MQCDGHFPAAPQIEKVNRSGIPAAQAQAATFAPDRDWRVASASGWCGDCSSVLLAVSTIQSHPDDGSHPHPRSSPLTPRPLTKLAWFSCEIVAHPVAHEVFPLRRALLSTLSRNVLLSTPCYRLCDSQVVAPQNRFLSRRHRIVDSTALAVASPTLWSLLQPRGLLVRCFGKPS